MSQASLRIKTTFENGDYIHTLFFGGKWLTMRNQSKKTFTSEADCLLVAGQNHLQACTKVMLGIEARYKAQYFAK